MFSPSDFNNAVPQFSHGSYASNPTNPLYIEEPGSDEYIHGVAPLQTLPAQWWNWLCNQFTGKLNKINVYVKNIFEELTNLLELVGVTPNASEGRVITSGQVKDAFETKYPNYISKFIHTLAELWSYTGTVIVGDVTTTQTSRLAIFEHVNTSDASTSPATKTDKYKTKYVDKLPIGLGGTNANNAGDAMVNLVDPLTTVAQNTGLITDEVVFERNDNGVKSVQKMDLSEVGRIVSSTRVNVPIISASSPTINSAVLAAGDSIQVLFTADIGGTDSTTGLSLIYNGTTIPVKVAKNGSLVDFTATETAINIFKYLQEYTTLELYYDGTNFVIMGNPLVLSSADYEIYANGLFSYNKYSTEEVNTGEKWIDGKPIYRKVLIGDTLPPSGATLLTNVDTLVNCYGTQYYIPSGVWYHFPYGNASASGDIVRPELVESTHIVQLIRYGAASSSSKYKWTFEYTKATD